jgi:glycosyltransferase involved in cell wall biosynthesis
MVSKIGLIIPAFNEESSIGLVLDSLPTDLLNQVIVVDNASDDHTAAVAAQHGAQVVRENKRGYGSACLKGISQLSLETDIVVFLDGDFSDYPEELPKLLKPISEEGADLVIGSRMQGKQRPDALLPQAYWGNRLAVFLIRLFWGYRYTDLGPFRAIRNQALKKIAMQDQDFGWTVEMQVKAITRGLKIREVPVCYRKRIGKSKISGTFSGTVKAGMKILYTIGKYVLSEKKTAAEHG